MAKPIDDEPYPKRNRLPDGPTWPEGRVVHRFEDGPPIPKRDFTDVLGSRRSRSGGALSIGGLGAILRLATHRRERRLDGRFGVWESRTAPSAGGTHGIGLVALPMIDDNPMGLYSPDAHALIGLQRGAAARTNAARFLVELNLPPAGWFVQLIVDTHAYSSRYENPKSLILRDAGALSCTTCLLAEALGVSSRMLGHLDKGIIEVLDLGMRYSGVGGIHLTGRGEAD